ncbi:LLM class flavin-dependent oxidoreductase [Rhizobium grahamii]|uniref:Oxidoreductase n=1 Tax=Rhizobium grahamii CCGE 502 TaxID=990285 RepID=S3H5U3_9HYPH|nr:LLM class flavin-dependent oxidoreductase [Rhizobium grahamii]EPE94322.1 oxidoreductase [Rhizobium grahamii CCGE 502]
MGSLAITHIGFLSPGNYAHDNPFDGLDETLKLFEFAEALGFDSGWVRQRHLEPGISSAAAFLGAATQRTRRIQLGTAVIPIGYESPFRLAEDLSTVDVLSKGRLNVGLSAGRPLHADLMGALVFDGEWEKHDFSHERVRRFVANLQGEFLGADDRRIATPFGPQRPRLQPFAKGLHERVWYGGGSQRSAAWAGEQGLNLLTGNVISGEDTDDFFTAQVRLIETYRRAGNGGRRIALGRVIVPFDGADEATRRRYSAYAAERDVRTLRPTGEKRTLFAKDLAGTSAEILEQLYADPVLPHVNELRLELPYEFEPQQYRQILTDFSRNIAPRLGFVDKSKTK